MKSTSIACNIAIIPPPAIIKKAIAVSRRLKKIGGLYTLDGKKYFPHVTLYMTEFPKKNLLAVQRILRGIVMRTRSFQCTFSRVDHDTLRGYIVAQFRKNKAATTLHRSVVRLCNPLREGLLRSRDYEAFTTLTKHQQHNLVRYGYRDAHVLYHPHLTFSRLPSLSRHVKISPLKTFSFPVRTIGLFVSGKHGTCRRLLARFTMDS